MSRKELLYQLSKIKCSLSDLENVITGECIEPQNVLLGEYMDENGLVSKVPLYKLMTIKSSYNRPLERECFYFDLKNKVVIDRIYKICFNNGRACERNIKVIAPLGYNLSENMECLCSYIPSDRLGGLVDVNEIIRLTDLCNAKNETNKTKKKVEV